MGLGRLIESMHKPLPKQSVQQIVYRENMRPKRLSKLTALDEIHQMKNMLREEDWIGAYHLFIEFYHTMVNFRPRSTGTFHPSSLTQDCERRLWYDINGEERTDSAEATHTGRVQGIFDLGTFIHVYIQSMLMRAGALEAAEVPVINEKWKIDGHTDGVIKPGWFGLKESSILEIKTINLNGSKKLKWGPLEHHRDQAGLYADVLGFNVVYFVYYIKDSSEMIELVYKIERDRLDDQYDKMRRIMTSKDGHELETVCPKITCEAAKMCSWRSKCFGIK